MNNSRAQVRAGVGALWQAGMKTLTEVVQLISAAESAISTSDATTSGGSQTTNNTGDAGATKSKLRTRLLMLSLGVLLMILTGQISLEQRCTNTADLTPETQSILRTRTACSYQLLVPLLTSNEKSTGSQNP